MLPAGLNLDPDVQRILNDLFRRLSVASVGTARPAETSGGGLLVLAVPGTLSIRSSAAPLVSFTFVRSTSRVTALLKRAAIGGEVTVRLKVAGTEIAALTVPAGATTATTAVVRAIAADAVVEVDITAVGSTFPGADLTLLISI